MTDYREPGVKRVAEQVNVRVLDSDKSPAQQPPIQDLCYQLAKALASMRDEFEMLNEKLGYVSLSAPPQNEAGASPERERSPMAHNLYCILYDVNIMAYRIQQTRQLLEI